MNLRIKVIIKFVISITLLIISNTGIFLLDENNSAFIMSGLIMIDIIALKLTYDLFKLTDKDWTTIFNKKER